MTRSQQFAQDFFGMVLLGVHGKADDRRLGGLRHLGCPNDWLAFFGFSLSHVRAVTAVALGWALWRQVSFKHEDVK